VPKPNASGPDAFRLVHDLRAVNLALKEWPSKLETIRYAARMLQPNDFMFSVDWHAGYHHIGIRPQDRQYLGFEYRGMFFHYNVLPFGLRFASSAFSHVVKQLVRHWRSVGVSVTLADGSAKLVKVRVTTYIDDMLFAASTFGEAAQVRDAVLLELRAAGVSYSNKTQLEPTQTIRHLGFNLNTTAKDEAGKIVGKITVPDEKLQRVAADIAELRDTPQVRRSTITARRLAKTVGRLISMAAGLTPAQLMTRSLSACVEVRKGTGAQLSDAALAELDWWGHALLPWASVGAPVWRSSSRPALVVTNDASPAGWAAELAGEIARCQWGPEGSDDAFSPFQVVREMRAARLAVETFSRLDQRLRGTTVVVRTDCVAVVAYIRNGGGRSAALTAEARLLWAAALAAGCSLDAVWIPGTRMIALGVDGYSRDQLVDPCDWTLSAGHFERSRRAAARAFSLPHNARFSIDRMATLRNRQTQRYSSRLWDQSTEAVDAFSVANWNSSRCPCGRIHRELNWVSPDFADIPQTLHHMQACGARGAVVVPERKDASWWPLVDTCKHMALPRTPGVFQHGTAPPNSVPESGPPPFSARVVFVDFGDGTDALAPPCEAFFNERQHAALGLVRPRHWVPPSTR
jgi:hypothetical protein